MILSAIEDANTIAQVLEIYRKMSFDSDTGPGIRTGFLTDIISQKDTHSSSICKSYQL
jgi:hypothetical protein